MGARSSAVCLCLDCPIISQKPSGTIMWLWTKQWYKLLPTNITSVLPVGVVILEKTNRSYLGFFFFPHLWCWKTNKNRRYQAVIKAWWYLLHILYICTLTSFCSEVTCSAWNLCSYRFTSRCSVALFVAGGIIKLKKVTWLFFFFFFSSDQTKNSENETETRQRDQQSVRKQADREDWDKVWVHHRLLDNEMRSDVQNKKTVLLWQQLPP